MKHITRPMRDTETVAGELLRCSLSWEPNACLVGNVMAAEVAALASRHITSCPKCGAEPWVNIDCDLCLIAHALQHGEMP
jgi:hypothetical protein